MHPQLGPGYRHELTTRFSVYSIAVPEKLSAKRNEAKKIVSSGGGKEKNEAKKQGSKASNGEKTKQTAPNEASKASSACLSSSLKGNASSNPIGSNMTVISSYETNEDLDSMMAAVTKTGAEVRQMKKVLGFCFRQICCERPKESNPDAKHLHLSQNPSNECPTNAIKGIYSTRMTK